MFKKFLRTWKVEHFLFAAGVLSGALISVRGPLSEQGRFLSSRWWSSTATDRIPAASPSHTGEDECFFESGRHGSLGYQRTRYKTGVCSVYIRNTEKMDHFRSFSFGSNGSMMVFNQFGESGRDNGARLFYFFPRVHSMPAAVPHLEVGELAVRTASGALVRFSTADESVLGTSGELVLDIKDEIVAENAGGVEVSQWNGIYLDLGFTMREQPYYKRPEGESVFKDSQGRSCKVRNKEIYDYSNPEEPIFKLSDDAVALAFLESRCAGLDLSSLKPLKAPDSSESEMIPAGEEAELPVRPDDTVSIRSGSGSAY